MLAGIERRLREVLGLRVQTLPSRDHQEQVESYFDSMSSYWAEIYSTESVLGVIQQRRMALVLEWIDELALPRESRILEVGCGAGLTTIELARRGYTVYATDSSRAMVERTLRGVIESDVGDRVKVFRGDVYSLPFEDDMFTSVFAMGVISWLESPNRAVREMARVVKPGGYVILSSLNLMRLDHLIDPRLNPAFAPLKHLLKRTLERAGLRKHPGKSRSSQAPQRPRGGPRNRTTSYIDWVIFQNHLENVKAVTLGFGPYKFLGCKFLPDSIGIKLHHRLQALADRGVAGLRSTGSQYVVLARKPRTFKL